MKRHLLLYLIALPALVLTLTAQAHDPKEHMNEKQTPDCAAMKEMDHSKMNMNDPVMQAMMQKCMEQNEKISPDSHSEAKGKEPAKHQHK